MIFVDSSAWFAIFSRRDANHPTAMSAIRSFNEQLVTTDYVVDETLTLLTARRERRRAIAFGRRVIESQWAKVVQINEQDFASAWETFKQFGDKEWSFTDCTSRVVIERLGVQRAFAFDDHFRQFGTVAVIP
jgi:predicted nucleic acid-binding protein